MKIIFTILTLLSINLAFAQEKREVSVPQVKESWKIDRLIDKMMGDVIPGQSCIVIALIDYYRYYEIDVIVIKTDLNNINFYRSGYTENLRSFEYRGYTIFVTGEDDKCHLFTKTKKTKIFTFQNGVEFKKQDDSTQHNHFLPQGFFKYVKGKIVSRSGDHNDAGMHERVRKHSSSKH